MSNTIKSIYTDYQNILKDTMDWRLERDKLRKFYFGQQYSSKLSDTYEDRGWVDIVINKIRPLLRSRVSMLVASKPQGKVYGVSKKEMDTANALEEFLDFHFYNSDGQLLMEDVSMASQREGIGYFVINIDPMASYGQGEIKIDFETFENIFVKKTSRVWDYKDAGRIIHSRLVGTDDFLIRYPKYSRDTIEEYRHPYDIPTWEGKERHKASKEIGMPQTPSNLYGDFIREFDVYDRIFEDVRILHHIPTNTIEVLNNDHKLTGGEKQLISAKVIREAIAPVPRIKWTKCIANSVEKGIVIATQVLPIEYFPIIPLHDERTGNSCSLGEVDFFAGLQEMLNQSTSLMILHAALSSLGKIIVDEGKITDIKTFRENWALPGGVIPLPFDPQTGKPPIEIVRPEPINQAFWTMMQHWGTELEYEAMQNPMNWGSAKDAPETFSATLQIHEWAQNALRLPLNHTEIALQRVYEVILQWSRTFYGYRWFDVIRNDMPEDNFINSPIPLPVGEENGEKVTSTHDIRSLRAKYRIRMGSTAPSQNVAYMSLYQQLAQQYPVFLKQFVQYLDIPADEKRELIQAVDIVGQQKATIDQQQQAIQFLQKTIQKISAENLEQEKKGKLQREEMRIIKKVSKLEAKLNEIETTHAAKREIDRIEAKARLSKQPNNNKE